MTLYETIFVRRAVREYDMTPLPDETLFEILQYVNDTPGFPEQTARFSIIPLSEATGGITAPHYIVAECAPSDVAFANVGFVLQRADLYLQSLGYGSVWLGMTKPRNPSADFCMVLGFGKTQKPLRDSLSQFQRLPLDDISAVDNGVAQAVRLAPSAVNSQPWTLHFREGVVSIVYTGRGAMQLVLRKKMNKVDMGIAARHAVLALEHEGHTVTSVAPRAGSKQFTLDIQYR